MRCLVTGAAGFIGSQVAEALLGRHDRVLGIDCFTDYYAKTRKLANLESVQGHPDFIFAEADLASAPLEGYLQDVDVVFHLSAQPGVRASWGSSFSYYLKDNVAATQRLLEACKDHPVKRFVYASSSSVYGDAERFPTPEDSTPRPLSPYGATKLAAEHLCEIYRRSFGVPTVTLRYFTVYGPRQRPDMAFARFIAALRRDEELSVFGDGEQARDFTFVSDTVAATLLASEATPGSVYNVGTGRVVSVNHVLAILADLVGKVPKVRRLPAAAGDVRRTCADVSRIRRDLAFEARMSIEEGLRRQVAESRNG